MRYLLHKENKFDLINNSRLNPVWSFDTLVIGNKGGVIGAWSNILFLRKSVRKKLIVNKNDT